MKLKIDFTAIPNKLKVNVIKGSTGVLIAELPELDIITEAEDLNELFFQVNDLIYTYYDVPKEYQDEMSFIPNMQARLGLLAVAKEQKESKPKHFTLNSLYSQELCERIISA